MDLSVKIPGKEVVYPDTRVLLTLYILSCKVNTRRVRDIQILESL